MSSNHIQKPPAPISIIPGCLLVDIFESHIAQSVPTRINYSAVSIGRKRPKFPVLRAALVLTHVCSQWRKIGWSYGRFWSHIMIRFELSAGKSFITKVQIKLGLRMCKMALMSMKTVLRGIHGGCCFNWHGRKTHSWIFVLTGTHSTKMFLIFSETWSSSPIIQLDGDHLPSYPRITPQSTCKPYSYQLKESFLTSRHSFSPNIQPA